MVYDGWSFEVEMLISDEWYLWDDFVHFVRYRLGQLSFTYDRRSIRQHLDLPRSLVSKNSRGFLIRTFYGFCSQCNIFPFHIDSLIVFLY